MLGTPFPTPSTFPTPLTPTPPLCRRVCICLVTVTAVAAATTTTAAAATEDNVLVIPGLGDALEDVLAGLVETALRRHVPDDVGRAPAARGLLEAADVEDAVVQVVDDLAVGELAQEGAVGVHAVAGEQGAAGRGHVAPDVVEQAGGRLLRRRRRRHHRLRQPALRVRPRAPLVHHVHPLPRLVHYRAPARRVHHLQRPRRDDAEDLDDFVAVRVEARHLELGVAGKVFLPVSTYFKVIIRVLPILPRASNYGSSLPRSQSIQGVRRGPFFQRVFLLSFGIFIAVLSAIRAKFNMAVVHGNSLWDALR